MKSGTPPDPAPNDSTFAGLLKKHLKAPMPAASGTPAPPTVPTKPSKFDQLLENLNQGPASPPPPVRQSTPSPPKASEFGQLLESLKEGSALPQPPVRPLPPVLPPPPVHQSQSIPSKSWLRSRTAVSTFIITSLLILILILRVFGGSFPVWKLRVNATFGSTDAQYRLGILYFYGFGVAQSNSTAKRYLAAAAAKDYGPAVTALGSLQAPDNMAEAMRLWKRGAHLHQPWSEYLLGAAYLQRQDEGEENFGKAIYWLNKAWRDGIDSAKEVVQKNLEMVAEVDPTKTIELMKGMDGPEPDL